MSIWETHLEAILLIALTSITCPVLTITSKKLRSSIIYILVQFNCIYITSSYVHKNLDINNISWNAWIIWLENMKWNSECRYHMNALMTLLPVTLSVPAMRRERPVVALVRH